MTFIPNEGDAPLDGEQAELDTVDLNIILDGFRLRGVKSGCAVSPSAPAAMTAEVAAGVISFDNGVDISVTGGTVTFAAADSTTRFDLVVADSSGTLSVINGAGVYTVLYGPVFPTYTDKVVLAAVEIKSDTTEIDADNIIDKRISLKFPTTTAITEGTNLYHTPERVMDVVGALLVDSTTIDITYNDAGDTLTLDVIPGGIDHGGLAGLADDDHTQYTRKDTLSAIGDIYYASAISTPARLGVTVPAANVRNVLGLDNGDTVPAWKTALDGTTPVIITAGGAGAPGTSLIFAHRDHDHPAPVTWPATAHNILSSTHSDTLADTVVRGDIMFGNSTPKWARLAKGAAGSVLYGDGTDTAWTINPYIAGAGRFGSASAPNNTTAGDLTAVRLNIGNDSAFAATTGEFVQVTGTLTDTSAGAKAFALYSPTFAPASNSSGEFRALYFQGIAGSGAGITLSIVEGGYIETRHRQDGAVGTMTGLVTVAVVVDSSSPATVGTVTNARSIEPRLFANPSGSIAGAITTGVGIDFTTNFLTVQAGSSIAVTDAYFIRIQNQTVGGSLSVTNLYGIEIGALSKGGTLNVGIKNLSNIRQTGYGSFLGATTTPLNVTDGDVSALRFNIGTDTAHSNNSIFKSVTPAGTASTIANTFTHTNSPAAGTTVHLISGTLTLTPSANANGIYHALILANNHTSGAFNIGTQTGATISAARQAATGTTTSLTGVDSTATGTAGVITTATGVKSTLSLQSAVSGTSAFGFDFLSNSNSGASFTNYTAYNIRFGIGNTVVATNFRGLNVPNLGQGNVTNVYAIDIAAQSGAATLNIGIRNASNFVQTGYGSLQGATTVPAVVTDGWFTAIGAYIGQNSAPLAGTIAQVLGPDAALSATSVSGTLVVNHSKDTGAGQINSLTATVIEAFDKSASGTQSGQITGLIAKGTHTGAGIVSALVGAEFRGRQDAGTVTLMVNANIAGSEVNGGAVTTWTGLQINNLGNASITNSFGIDIAAQSGSATINVGIRNASNYRGTQYLSLHGATTTPLMVTDGDISGIRGRFGTNQNNATNTIFNVTQSFTAGNNQMVAFVMTKTGAGVANNQYALDVTATDSSDSGNQNNTNAIRARVNITGAATHSTVIGIESTISSSGAGGISGVTAAFAATIGSISSGTVAQNIGLLVENMGDAQVTNSYAIKIDAQSNSATSSRGIQNSSNMSTVQWARFGATAVPANTTDGDVSAIRLLVGTDAAFTTGVTAAELLGRSRIGGVDSWLEFANFATIGNFTTPAAGNTRLITRLNADLAGATNFKTLWAKDENAFESSMTLRARTFFPMPLTLATATAGVALPANNTSSFVSHTHIEVPIKVNKILYNVSGAGNAANVIRIAIYSENGTQKYIDVTDAVGAATGVRTIDITDTTLAPGNYLILICHSTFSTTACSVTTYTVDTTITADVASEPDLGGTLTITAGAAPATIDPTALTTVAPSGKHPVIRLLGTALGS